METFLYIVFFLSCIVLVVAVLLQPGKTDAGALFTSGVSSTSMNPRGTASVLSKLTIVTATIFMLTALLLSLPALTGQRSVMETDSGNNITAPTNANTSNANVANTANSATNSANTTDEKKDSEESKDKKSEEKEEKKADNEKPENKSETKADEVEDKAKDKEDKTEEKKDESK